MKKHAFALADFILSAAMLGCLGDESPGKQPVCYVPFSQSASTLPDSIAKYPMGDLTGLSRAAILDSSRKALDHYLEKSESSYTYIIAKGPYFFGTTYTTGGGNETKVTFRRGIPVERAYQAYRRTAACNELTDAYVETGDIGYHTAGDPAHSLPERHQECAQIMARDTAAYWLHLGLDSNHIIQSCFYGPRPMLMDWSPSGFSIQYLIWN